MRILLAIPVFCAAFSVALPGHAAGREEERRVRMPESVQRVETETGGRVLQVRPVQRGGQEVYRMKVLTPEGRVRVMQDDPRRRQRDQAPPVRERDVERERLREHERPRESERPPPRGGR